MRAIAFVLLVGVVLGAAVAYHAIQPRLPAAERGRRLAEQTGCFGCHGAEGTRGTGNPGRKDRTVPNFEDDVMMYADSPGQIREWIMDGVSAKKAQSETWKQQRALGALKMPAFKRRLSASQVDDLVAFVQATSTAPDPASPADSLASHGLERAKTLGCTGCHGPGGRLARPNPGSLKGYVPSWDGGDFPDLVRNRAEFDQWVERGVSARFEHDRLARHFLDRATMRMPAFREHLEPGDLDMLWAYVEWTRATAARDAAGRGEARK